MSNDSLLPPNINSWPSDPRFKSFKRNHEVPNAYFRCFSRGDRSPGNFFSDFKRGIPFRKFTHFSFLSPLLFQVLLEKLSRETRELGMPFPDSNQTTPEGGILDTVIQQGKKQILSTIEQGLAKEITGRLSDLI